MQTPPEDLITQLAAQFATLPMVEAIALGGSRAGMATDQASDIDLYLYTRGEVPLEARAAIVARLGGASRADLGLDYWGPGDEWFHAPTGIEVDCVYFDAGWMEGQLQRVIRDHQASMGYTTCFWYTIANSRPLHDPNGWFARLQATSRQPYPEALRQNILALNHPVLRGVIPAYAHQIEKAVRRGDLVSVNHRLAALLASYFDIVFAANRVLHPGEKRLLALALERCPRLPEGMASDLTAVLNAAGQGGPELMPHLNRALDRLDLFLRAEGFQV